MGIEVVRFEPGSGVDRASAIRRDVFVRELGVTVEEEFDDLDDAPDTVHVVAVVGGADAGTARLIGDPDRPGVVHITRVAVSADARGTGVGRALMTALEAIALADYALGEPRRVRLELAVVENAVGFYESLGYEVGTTRHVEVRIWHREAHKDLVERI